MITQEDKELQLIDLCARLPYGVKVRISSEIDGYLHENTTTLDIDNLHKYMLDGGYYKRGLFYKTSGFQLLPYLRSMSSMTEEEFVEYYNIKYNNVTYRDKWKRIDVGKYHNVGIIPIDKYLDWLNAHHFDYRGLIPKKLAIEVTKENNPYKE